MIKDYRDEYFEIGEGSATYLGDKTGIWFKVSERLPQESGKYVVDFSGKNTNFDVDDFNTVTGQWEFYNKEGMVQPKYWMKLPLIKKGVDDE